MIISSLKSWVKVTLTISLLLGGLIFGLAGVELGLHIAGIEYKTFHTVDEQRGWAGRPYAAGWFRGEGEAYIKINSEGFHDREHLKVKPQNTLRIALLGDSFTEAVQVPQAQGIAAVIERELKNCPTLAGRDLEVMNFGVGGYGTDQELITLREKVWNYSPDLVLLNFYPGNDVRDNSHKLNENLVSMSPEDNESLMKPFFVYSNGSWEVDTSFVSTDVYRLQKSWWHQAYLKAEDNSRILQILKKLEQVKYALGFPGRDKWAQIKLFKSTKLEQQNYQLLTEGDFVHAVTSPEWKQSENLIPILSVYTPSDSEWQEAWQLTEGLISLMHREVSAKGADFAVVILTTPILAYPEPVVRQQYGEAVGVTDWFYPEKRITALGEKDNFTTINLGQTFQAYAEEKNVCLHGFDNAYPCFGHFNALGHQLAGEIVAKTLCQKFIIRN
jgi:hypothetical protein